MKRVQCNRRAMALPVVLVLIILIGIGAGAVYFAMQAGLRRTAKVRGYTEHLYLSEAILANLVNRLKKHPWEIRFYKGPGTAPFSTVEAGDYRGAVFTAVVEDVTEPGTTKVLPNLTDILIRVTLRDLTRSFFARVSVNMPTVLRPTNTNIVRFIPIEEDVNDAAARQKVADEASNDSVQQKISAPDARTVARIVASLDSAGKTPEEIQKDVTEQNISDRSTQERVVLDLWDQAEQIVKSGGSGKYTTAFDLYKQALDTALTQNPQDQAKTAPRSLYDMAKSKVGEFDERMNVWTDPTTNPATDPSMRSLLDDAITYLQRLMDDYSTSDDAAYALWLQAKIYQKMGDDLAAKQRLNDLKAKYPDLHLWGESQTVSGGTDAKDGVVDFMKTFLDREGDYFLSKNERPDDVGQIYFVDKNDNKVRITSDPRPKDLVTVSPDTGKISYRAKMPDGSYRIVVVDFDGSTSIDVTQLDGEYKPPWAPIVDKIDFAPILHESIPDSTWTTDVLNLSGLPPIQGGGANTLTDLIAYGNSLVTTLQNSPYTVKPPYLKPADSLLSTGDDKKGKSESAPGQIKKDNFNTQSIEDVIDAIRILETIKTDIDSGGGDKWQ